MEIDDSEDEMEFFDIDSYVSPPQSPGIYYADVFMDQSSLADI